MPAKDEEFLPRAAFASAVTSSQLFGIGAMIMTGVWLSKYQGGFAWDGSEKQFNYHPLFMVISLVFLNAEGKLQCCYLLPKYLKPRSKNVTSQAFGRFDS